MDILMSMHVWGRGRWEGLGGVGQRAATPALSSEWRRVHGCGHESHSAVWRLAAGRCPGHRASWRSYSVASTLYGGPR